MNRALILFIAIAALLAIAHQYPNYERDDYRLDSIDERAEDDAKVLHKTTASAISTNLNNRNACHEAASSAYTTTHSTVTTTTTTTTENMLVCSTVIPPETPLEHWLYTSEIDERALNVLNRPDIAGAQVLYNWKSLESNKGEYDFREIRNDMQRVQAKGKKFWIQLQDRSFSPQLDPVPRYMKTNHYNNGSAPQCDGESCDKHFKIDGWVAQQWNPRVRERFQALLKAMAEELNGKIYGLNLAETSIEVDTQANNYTHEGYFLGELENAGYAASVFNKTFTVQYVNFWPDGWNNTNGRFTKSFEFFASHCVGAGGPDLAPYRPGQVANSYPFIAEYRNSLPITVMSVQEPTLNYTNPKTGFRYTKTEFVKYANEVLGVKIIFWAAKTPWLSSTGVAI
ncbi:uncharacterized protein BBA_10297 [Beauveria bassiana ARSEF 2860]|uniref:Uncharacterized protein n=1 Tax=Beauveria bassiana (strain ARSEF 2860) TaxID=655819 RepID=J4UER2_BEAB2|nr:uncharacterized protein BBA_10297 [Beauveria bassiana ARSEF 2860]EJP60752.1 hypothetical protein BBA_10297 [Beauveria bassiana ARSEF 2860]